MADWKEIWSRTRQLPAEKQDLQFLIEADGFNSGAGKIAAPDWLAYIEYVTQLAQIVPNDSIYEIGCGSGAFLYPFYQKGHAVGGIDYSSSLIEIANRVMPNMNFDVQEALQLDTSHSSDVVIANSVFQYFPSLTYATEVIERMYAKAKRRVILLDLNDIAFEEEALAIRKGALSEGEYEEKYKGLDHLFYDRQFIEQVMQGKQASVHCSDQQIDNYGNNKFRFNVVIEKW
ncbi:class I SAM-dependent methyltransferase [Paenibacillus nuruki]|uniref:class I SAM-dependent methyltransferase n=1 Tax=Paenibacillus nuruki TaxID=1886670 RepID=UPI002803B0FC|nr:class I SAM-dependent methyltransferase [Paenibacillus nuruki]CAJ1317880.1 Methyltransferase domain-containing protein [Paenibacillus nuruki]